MQRARITITISISNTRGGQSGALVERGDGLLGGVLEVECGGDAEAALVEQAAALAHIGALEAHDDRHFHLSAERAGRADHSLGDRPTIHNTAKNVHLCI